MNYLTDAELSLGAASQDAAWGVGSWSDKSTRANAPADLAEDRSVADHRSDLPEGGYSA